MKFFLLALFVAAAAAAPLDNQAVEMIVNGVPEGEALELGGIVDIKLKEHVNGALASSSDLLHPLTAVGLAEAAAIAGESIVPTPIQVIDQPANLQPDAPPSPVQPPSLVPIVPKPEVPAAELPTPIVLPELVLPEPIAPEISEVIPVPVPEAIVPIPAPIVPEAAPIVPAPIDPAPIVPSPIVPAPIVPIPAPIVPAPEPIIPVPEPVVPEPVPEPAAQLPNEIFNDGIVQVQVNGQEAGIMSSLQSWFNMVVNYFSNGVQTSHQIV